MRDRSNGQIGMDDDNTGRSDAWWRIAGPEEIVVTEHGTTRLRDEHWRFFEENALPLMSKLVRTAFPTDAAELIRNRLSNAERFRASEYLYALLSDLSEAESNSGIWASCAVEFLTFSRLAQDDVVDCHDYRWGVPTLYKLYGGNIATLAATEMASLAVICAEEADRKAANPETRASGLSAPAIVAEYVRRMASGMSRELLFNAIALPETEYIDISTAKHCNGVLCTRLCQRISSDLDGATASSLRISARATDIAAAIANDTSETDQRRGLDAVRFSGREQRGEKTEFQLGRPSIFHVFLADDTRVRNQETEAVLDSINLRELEPAELLVTLSKIGGIEYARRKRDAWRENALSSLPQNFRKVAEWMNSTATLNVKPLERIQPDRRGPGTGSSSSGTEKTDWSPV